MIRTKICGVTRVEDALAAARFGADAIGLVFVDRSSRHVTIDQARALVRALPPFVTRVALFMNPESQQVRNVLDRVPIDVLQFHGTETADFCAGFDRPWVKALALSSSNSDTFEHYGGADAILLDTHAGQAMGGSGETFDWSGIPELPRPLILAGGLTPDNVIEACRSAHPAAVDVSSGVECRPGVKSDSLVQRFINSVNEVNKDG
jgi:phosphoribosylanthranilate isomerase